MEVNEKVKKGNSYLIKAITRELPYKNCTNPQVIGGVIYKGLRPTIPDDWRNRFGVSFIDLLKQCWSENPDDRPTMKEVNEVLSQLSSRKEGMSSVLAKDWRFSPSPSTFH